MIESWLRTDPNDGTYSRRLFNPKEYRPKQTKSKYFVDGVWKSVPTKIYITHVALVRDRPPQHFSTWKQRWFPWRLVVDYTESK